MSKDKLTIGFVLDDGLDKPGGVQQYILGLGDWLSARGHKVHYLVGETHRRDIKNVHVLARNIKVSFSGNTLSIPLMGSKKTIDKVLSEIDFDVLHVQVPYHPLMGGRIISRAYKQTAIVGTFHILPYGRLASVGSSLLGLVTRWQNRYFDKFFAVSKPAQEFARTKYGIKSTIVPNFVDFGKYKSAKVGGKTRIVFVGRFVERKGCRQLLEALKYAKDKGLLRGEIIVDICGDGPQRQKLKKFCQENNLDEVKFRGRVSETEKIRRLGQADIAVFPSISGESFGIVLLEAMAAGCLVIGGDNPGYHSVLADAPGSLVNPKDTAGFAECLARTINDKSYRNKLYDKQQELVKRFDIDKVGTAILNGYYKAKRDKLKQKHI